MRSFSCFALLCLMNFAATAAQEVYPYGCKPFVIKQETVTLPAKTPRLILLHNLAQTDLWITHPPDEADTIENLSTPLQTNQWSALVLNQQAFLLNCIESNPGHEQQVPCRDVLAICEWPLPQPEDNIKIRLVAENMSLVALAAYLNRQGFELPQKAQ